MSNERIDYKAVIADMKARRADMDAAIATLEQQMLGAGEGPSDTGSADVRSDQRQEPTEIRSDSFFGLSIPDAIRKCFKMAKRPLSLSELTNSLKSGGLLTAATNLMATVSATLQRMKRTEGDVVSLGNGQWGLAEWYHGLRRDKVEAMSKPKGKSRKRGSRNRAKAKPPAPVKESQPAAATDSKPAPQSHPTGEQVERMKALHAAGKSYGEIAKELGVHHLAVYRELKPAKSKAA